MGVDGRYVVQDLPFGVYRLRLAAGRICPVVGSARDPIRGAPACFGDDGRGTGQHSGRSQ